MKNSPSEMRKNRLLVVTAVICGSIAAGLLFRARSLPKAEMSDAEAKRVGYASAQERRETDAAFDRYWPDIITRGGLTESQFRMAADTLDHGSWAAQLRIIEVLGYVRGETERKRALTLMRRKTMDRREWVIWRQAIRRWSERKKEPHVYEWLEATGNPNAISIADDLKKLEGTES